MCRVMRGELALEDLVGMSALSYVDTIRGPLEVPPSPRRAKSKS